MKNIDKYDEEVHNVDLEELARNKQKKEDIKINVANAWIQVSLQRFLI